MREKIFDILLNSEDYVSGEEISEQLGVSRAAVWKHIQALEQEGYKIDALRKKGYRLVANGIRQAEIEPYLKTKWLGRGQAYFPEVDSTNIIAKKCADEGVGSGFVVLADQQNAGRGRLGRAWQGPKGTGVWMSLVLRPELTPDLAPQITLATAVGVASALRELGYDAGIKWPNDIYISGKKVCGILTEMRADMDGIQWVVVGIGINCLNQNFPDELADIATSLAMNSDKDVIRGEVVAAMFNNLETAYEDLYANGFAAIREKWLANNITLHKRVKISTLKETFFGTALDMNEDGSLMVKREEGGNEMTLVTGDVFFA